MNINASNRRICTVSLAVSLAAGVILSSVGGCLPQKPARDTDTAKVTEPCTTQPARGPRRIWATSYLWTKAPDLVVEKWLTDKPETKGKYVLIEFWATWCPPCRRSIALLNTFHKKYGDELVVIGISEESEADVRKLKTPKVEYYSAIDTQMRMKKELGVFGIPHAIIIEPGGAVIWEGFPLLPGYELTEKTIEKILAIGRKIKSAKGK
ncbi:MAG: TlpA family protein disulfide reductase [bacterium]|nr:TlpA family protein disulfide reductase [bacterium]